MSYVRSRLNLRTVLVLTLLVLCGALLADAQNSRIASLIDPEYGTPSDQLAVRTDRDVSRLPLRSACTVIPSKELFITNRSVVDNCWRTKWDANCTTPTVTPARRGAWTLGGLLPGIFGTNDPDILSARTLRWFQEWETAQTVNGQLVPSRPLITDLVVDPWLAASGGTRLDMKKAPFRLLAIVARLDLRQGSNHPDGPTAGEARFIFNLLHDGQPTEFNVIVEYGLDAAHCADVLEWANAWHDLGSYSFGDSYNAALDELTHRFTKIGASPGKINGSAINQVRTNEVELGTPWELREFHLKASAIEPVPLVLRPVALTPGLHHNRTPLLANFINLNTAAIKANMYEVPGTFQQEPFRGGASPNPGTLGWDGPGAPCSAINDEKARHVFSLNTCSGCHGTETGTVFKHVEPRDATSASVLSGFLTGESVIDRCGNNRPFGDIDRRRVDLCQLLDRTCWQVDNEPSISYTH